MEVPSPFFGKILELNVKVGDKVSKGSLLAKIDSVSNNDEQKKEFEISNNETGKKI